jgi:homoserine kinase
VHVRVPATSANLGPGFDSAGLALGLHDDVVVRVVRLGPGRAGRGEGATTWPAGSGTWWCGRCGRRSSGWAASRPAAGALHQPDPARPRDSGSSSAAIVAGIVAACALVATRSSTTRRGLELADELEGHPDNVAACLHGGATFAWVEDGRPRALRLDAHPDLAPVVFVPATRSSTKAARGLLPATVPYADAVRNA